MNYTVELQNGVVGRGRGQTINLGSGGVLVRLEEEVAAGDAIELTIMWPARLNGGRALYLRIDGRILRATGPIVAVKLLGYHPLLTSASQAGP